MAGGGAAAKANIQAGDTVLSVNGEGPLRYEELLLAINTPRPTNLMFCRVGGTMNPLQRAQEAAQRKIQEMQGKEYQVVYCVTLCCIWRLESRLLILICAVVRIYRR